MANVRTNAERLADIRPRLPFGALSEVARSLGVTPACVSAVVAGKRKNVKVGNAVIDYYLNWVATEQAREKALTAALAATQPANQ